MSNYYTLDRKTRISSDYRPSFPVDPNKAYSVYQAETQNIGEALYRQTTIGKMLIDSLARAVIGTGLTPMSSPENVMLNWSEERITKFSRQAETYWRIVTNNVDFDYYGKDTFKQLQKIAFTNLLVVGDTVRHNGYRKTKAGTIVPYLQVISGRMVTQNYQGDTLNQTGGVIIDPKTGREVGYLIREISDDRNDTMSVRRVEKYNRLGRKEYELICLQKSDPSLVRGLPLLTTVRDDILNTNAFKDNYIIQSAIQNLFTGFLEKDKDAQSSSVPVFEKFSQAAERADESERKMEMGVGVIVELEPGEKITTTQRQPQGGEYEKFMKSSVGLDASAIGMSYQTTTNEYEASFSASRASINAADKNYAIWRDEFATKFCDPTWEQVIEHGILVGEIEVPEWKELSPLQRKALMACTWAGVASPQVDPLKEVKAYIEAINAGLVTREYAIRQLYGMDFEEVADRLKKEKAMLGDLLVGNTMADVEPGDEDEVDTDSDNDTDTEDDTDTEIGDEERDE